MTKFEIINLMIKKAETILEQKKIVKNNKDRDILQAKFDVLMETITTIQKAITAEFYDLNTPKKETT